MKVESADGTVAVKDLIDEMEAGHQLGFDHLEIDLFQRDTAGRRFGIVSSAIALDRKPEFSQSLDEAIPVLTWHCADNLLCIRGGRRVGRGVFDGSLFRACAHIVMPKSRTLALRTRITRF